MKQLEKNTLSTDFDSLARKWKNACLVDYDINSKKSIANEIIEFYEANLDKIHFLEKDLKLIEEIKFFLFLNGK